MTPLFRNSQKRLEHKANQTIVMKVEWFGNSFRLFCHMFLLAFLDLIVHNVQ